MSHVSALLALSEINEELMGLLTPERVQVLNSLHPSLARKGEQCLEGVIAPSEYVASVEEAARELLNSVSRDHFFAVARCRMEALHDCPPCNNPLGMREYHE